MKKLLQIKSFLVAFFLISIANLMAQVPVADFKACKLVIEVYDQLELTDLSTNSPNQWTWDVYDSSDLNDIKSINTGYVNPDPNSIGKNEYSQNPSFQFDLPGCYTVKLIAKNSNGTSQPKVKTCFVQVIDPYNIYLGYGTYTSGNDYGKIIDNGGLNMNYTNNQGVATKSYYKILPKNNQNITLEFKQIRLADAMDSMNIYDADTIVPNKLIATIKNSNNGTYPTFTSTGAKMFVIFYSNGSGNDSGFNAFFYAGENKVGDINKKIKVVKNIVNLPSVFVNTNASYFIKNYKREWYVSNVLQPQFTDKDTLYYTFNNTNTYTIKLKLTHVCDSVYNTEITGNNTLNIKDIAFKNFTIYPNPSGNKITVNLFNDANIEHYTLKVFSMTGALVNSHTIKNGDSIDVSELSNGIYNLAISNELNSSIIHFKFVKN